MRTLTLTLSAVAFAFSLSSAQAFVGFPSQTQSSLGSEARAVEQGSIPRELVRFDLDYAPGTVVVSTAQRRLYLVLPGGQAMRYAVGVGRPGFEWSGVHRISRKAEWPGRAVRAPRRWPEQWNRNAAASPRASRLSVRPRP